MSFLNTVKGIFAFGLAVALFPVALFANPDANTGGADVNEGCSSNDVFSTKLITNICWDCVQPIRVVGVTISGDKRKDRIPETASNQPVCACEDGLGFPHPGITTQFWEPYRMVEFPRVAGCMKALNGTRFPFSKTFIGTQGNGKSGDAKNGTFRHYHFYSFPAMVILDMFLPESCNPDGYVDVDIMFLSEIDPTWNNPTLAYFAMPENALLVSELAAVACIPDAVSATAKRPIQSLFWCAGTWGLIYPASGFDEGSDIINSTSLETARLLTVLHRRGFVRRTVGKDAMCGGVVDPTLPKSMYQFTLFDPVPETDDAHVLGESPLTWGLMKVIPAIGEDPSYIVWRWQDCCQTKSSN